MAIKAVQDLSKNDITEIKGFSKPPEGAKAVMKSLCILFGVPPDKVRGQTAKDGTQFDYWDPAKKKLLSTDLLKRCLNFDRDNMNPATIE